MGILTALMRVQRQRLLNEADAAKRAYEKGVGQQWLNHASTIDTPAGRMRLIAEGPTAGQNSAVNLTFLNMRPETHIRGIGKEKVSVARPTIDAIVNQYASWLASNPPQKLAFLPTTRSRDRLYRGILERLADRGVSPYSEVEPGIWERPLSKLEQGLERKAKPFLKRAKQKQTSAYQILPAIDAVKPYDDAVTYLGAPAAGAYSLFGNWGDQ